MTAALERADWDIVLTLLHHDPQGLLWQWVDEEDEPTARTSCNPLEYVLLYTHLDAHQTPQWRELVHQLWQQGHRLEGYAQEKEIVARLQEALRPMEADQALFKAWASLSPLETAPGLKAPRF